MLKDVENLEGALLNDQLLKRGIVKLTFYPSLEAAAPALWDVLAKNGPKRRALRDFVFEQAQVRK
jgi:hypothetical protein